MGIVHQQRQIRDRTIDATLNEPSEVAFADGLARLEARIVRLEGLVTQLSRDALRDAVTASLVTRDASSVTPVTPVTRRHVVPGLDPQARDSAKRHVRNERQRRYRERKKQRPAV
jgi:hypothetical protein